MKQAIFIFHTFRFCYKHSSSQTFSPEEFMLYSFILPDISIEPNFAASFNGNYS